MFEKSLHNNASPRVLCPEGAGLSSSWVVLAARDEKNEKAGTSGGDWVSSAGCLECQNGNPGIEAKGRILLEPLCGTAESPPFQRCPKLDDQLEGHRTRGLRFGCVLTRRSRSQTRKSTVKGRNSKVGRFRNLHRRCINKGRNRCSPKYLSENGRILRQSTKTKY